MYSVHAVQFLLPAILQTQCLHSRKHLSVLPMIDATLELWMFHSLVQQY